MTKTLVFVYGTLKRGYGNNVLLSTSKFICEAVTVGDYFKMYDGGFPYVTKNGVSRISGELFEVDDPMVLKRLDQLEGVPSHYVRHTTEFTSLEESSTLSGFMYVASESIQKYLEENKSMFSKGEIVPNDEGICSWNPRNISYSRTKESV